MRFSRNFFESQTLKMRNHILRILVVSMVLIQVLGYCMAVNAEAASATQGYVNNCSAVNVRSGPAKTYKIVTSLNKYSSVTINGSKNGWYKVSCTKNSKTYSGYINGKYVTKGTAPKSSSAKSSSSKTACSDNSSKVKSNGKVIYLTFDDGPGQYTDKLLDVLDKYDVKATFFVTNQFPKYQYCIKEEAERGHTVAVHSYSHEYSIYNSSKVYWEDFDKMQKIVKKQTGKNASFVRFPGGTSNTVSKKHCKGIMTTLAKEVTKKGYYYCDWNVSSGDAGGTKSTAQVIKNIEAGCKKHQNSVVLQHDIKSYSVDAVESVIKWGLANGYTFKALTSGSEAVHQKINN